jgi:methionine-rich copper-binding protein CopC
MKLNWIAAGLLASMLIAPSALAHEQLIEQSPGEGQVVEAGPLPIELVFSNDLLDLGSGAEIVVTDPTGEIVTMPCATINGAVANTTVDVDVAGSYLVAWRVVSGDGHPIEGSFSFEVTNQTGYVAGEVLEPCMIASASGEESTSPEFSYWLLFGSMGLVAGGLFLYLRPRKK